MFVVLLGVVLAAPGLWATPPPTGQTQGGVTQFPALPPPPGSGQAPAATPTPQVGTGLILGQVIDAATGEPLADVLVTPGRGGGPLAATPGGAPAVNVFQPVVTGADGRFVFRNLPKG